MNVDFLSTVSQNQNLQEVRISVGLLQQLQSALEASEPRRDSFLLVTSDSYFYKRHLLRLHSIMHNALTLSL